VRNALHIFACDVQRGGDLRRSSQRRSFRSESEEVPNVSREEIERGGEAQLRMMECGNQETNANEP
jgi:hypothetical protein